MYYFGRSYYNATSYARIGKIDEGLKVINDLELNLQKPFVYAFVKKNEYKLADLR